MTRDAVAEGVGSRWAALMPHGTPLPDEDWAKRHRTISGIALLHIPAVLVYALVMGMGPAHALLETAPVAGLALLGARPVGSRLARELATTLSLVVASAVLVHLSGGTIELHFHFFVMVALVTLYQQWGPFLLAIGFVVAHHGIMGVVAASSVYNHPDAIAHPWRWALVHGTFISMAAAVGIANWKLNELSRHRAEDYFRRLYEGERAIVQRLEETDRVKSELVAAVSHEFRTPLTAILGFSETLKQAPPDGERAREFAERIHRQGRRLQQLIENLLEAERPFEPSEETCDAAQLVTSAVSAARAFDRDTDRLFSVEVEDGLELPVGREPARLLLDNLLGNALKFATPGTPISASGRRSSDGGAVLTVSNVGPQIAPDRLRRIFEPFVQGDSSNTRTADGVGLGLHIVQRIVTANGGQVRVTSDATATTFEITLPGRSVSEAPLPEATVAGV